MAADISAVMANLSATEGSNQPTNSTSIGANLDDNLRMLGALLAAFREASGWGGLKLTSVAGTNTVTGSVAVQGSITMAPTAYTTGMRFHFIPANTNTGATTLNVNSLGAKNVFFDGAACAGGELTQNIPACVEYDGTQFNIIGPLIRATQAQIEAGTINSRVVTPGRLYDSIGFSDCYTSTGQTVTAGGQLVLAHGLTRKPVLVQARLVCGTGEGGYSQNDEVIINAGDNDVGAAANRGISLVVDSTNITIRFGSDAGSISILRKDTGAAFVITNANWTLVVRAWA